MLPNQTDHLQWLALPTPPSAWPKPFQVLPRVPLLRLVKVLPY
jgi:hypothetical protein